MPANPSVVFTDVGLVWPDGSPALTGITGSFSSGRTGLVGLNGSGKSTLLRLAAGQLLPTTGTVAVSGEAAYLPQTLTLAVEARVMDLLGVGSRIDAIRAIESGDVAQRHFDTVGDDWDVEARATAALAGLGLPSDALDRRIGELSGGEAVLIAVAGLRLRGTPITLLDEPTNNLDRDARARLAEQISSWPGALIVVSHDTSLLELMDETAELYRMQLHTFDGPYSTYRAHVDAAQSAAEQAERTAEQVLRKEKRQRIEAETVLARRLRYANTDHENKRKPKIVMNQRRTEAQVSAGKLRGGLDDDVARARLALDEAADRVRDDASIHLDLPDPDVPRGRRLLELRDGTRTFTLQGPERIALIGPNGVGKTLLLESFVHGGPGDGAQSALASGLTSRLPKAVAHTDRIGYLAQRGDDLDGEASVLDVVRAAAPSRTPQEVRASLARFLLRGDAVHREVSALSGGERFRVALARLLLADPPAQLIILDEPTNHLDLQTVDQLVSALSSYRGGLLVVSHDDAFLARLDLTAVWGLDRTGRLTEQPPPVHGID